VGLRVKIPKTTMCHVATARVSARDGFERASFLASTTLVACGVQRRGAVSGNAIPMAPAPMIK
jgi:hypothetical protein